MKDKIYLAHSSDTEKGIGPQTYTSHIVGVYQKSLPKIERMLKYIIPDWQSVFKKAVLLAILNHDIGKLDDQCQKILSESGDEEDAKMLNHVQAGISVLVRKYKETKQLEYLIAAYLVQAHHIGFIDHGMAFSVKRDLIAAIQPASGLNDHSSCTKYGMEDIKVHQYVDSKIDEYLKIHKELVDIEEPKDIVPQQHAKSFIYNALALKMALSILVDSDHEDTAEHYKAPVPKRVRELNPTEKLTKLNQHISSLQSKYTGVTDENILERLSIRNEFYHSDNIDDKADIHLLDGTVGCGKTLKAMKVSLMVAEKTGQDTINVVLPYIALIDQSSDEYKRALGLESDLDINTVHSLYESKNLYYRKYQKGLNAPINILTSVNLFNMICTNKVGQLRNLHKLAGSVICIDEYPQIAEYEFWPLILKILEQLANKFSCKIVFSSGTAKHFWNMDQINPGESKKWATLKVSKIVSDSLYKKMLSMEERRVKVTETVNTQWTFEILAKEVSAQKGSIFVVLNTRKKGAGFISVLSEMTNKTLFFRHGGLNPHDREVQFEKMREMLENGEEIVLVSTPGADIGLDLSFNCGFRESSNFDAHTQMGGRISRGFEFQDAFLHLFRLVEEPMDDGEKYSDNPAFKVGSQVFMSQRSLWNTVSPQYCTDVAERELRGITRRQTERMDLLKAQWTNMVFTKLEEEACLIQDVSVSLLTDVDIFDKIRRLEFVKYSEIQEKMITLHLSKKNLDILTQKSILLEDDPNAPLQKGTAGIRLWTGVYDPEMYGVYADPIWNICKLKTLIV